MPKSLLTPRPLVLIVDDDDESRSLLEFAFRRQGYDVVSAETGRAAVAKARELRPAAVILDYHLGDMTAAKVLEELGFKDDEPHPVVGILTGSQSGSLPGQLLRGGADFYLVKAGPPASAVVEQVEAVMRRSSNGGFLRAGAVTLDIGRGILAHADGRAVRLTAVEARILGALMRARPGAASWGALESALCGVPGEVAEKASVSIRVEVSRLRRKLRLAGMPFCIETCRGLGLKLAAIE